MTISPAVTDALKATADAIPALIAAIPPHKRFSDQTGRHEHAIKSRAAKGALIEVVVFGWMSLDDEAAQAAGMPVFSQADGEEYSDAIERHRYAVESLLCFGNCFKDFSLL